MHTLEQLRAGALKGARRLDLQAGLTELPPEVFDLADSLEVLNLSGNALSELPSELPRLRKLKVLFCSDNRFTRVPEVVGQCESLTMVGFKSNAVRELPAASLPPRLRWLILTDNQLQALPANLGERPLEKVALAGNRLSQLPESMAKCDRLGLLRLSANQFDSLPGWLLTLPRLAWLAVGGNPWNRAREDHALASVDMPVLPWSSLRVGELLGQGASGHIHAAHHDAGEAGLRELAVKVFKGQVTSDGWPHSEWASSLAAGQHPHLISACAQLTGHPQDAEGLLMPRIGPEYRVLAGPPSLESCTRDVYAPHTAFTWPVALRLLQGVAQAALHLHQHGITHGDLYAHNLLWREDGDCRLGDFGAATLLPAHLDAPTRRAFEQVEVLAFGHLMEEVLQRLTAQPSGHAEAPARRLQPLRGACRVAQANARPTFADIANELASVAL